MRIIPMVSFLSWLQLILLLSLPTYAGALESPLPLLRATADAEVFWKPGRVDDALFTLAAGDTVRVVEGPIIDARGTVWIRVREFPLGARRGWVEQKLLVEAEATEAQGAYIAHVELDHVEFSVVPARGEFVLDEATQTFAPEPGMTVEHGFVSLVFDINGRKVHFYTDISRVSSKQGVTQFHCNSGRSFYVLGSGGGPMGGQVLPVDPDSTKEFEVHPGSVLPFVRSAESDAEIRAALETLASLRPNINAHGFDLWDSEDAPDVVKAAWSLWSAKVSEYLEVIAPRIGERETFETLNEINQLQLVNHPEALEILTSAFSGSDGQVGKAARQAVARLRSRLESLDSEQ